VRSPFFCVDFLHDLDFQVTVDKQLLQSGVLSLQHLEPLYLVGVELTKLLAPDVNGRVTHAVALGHHRHTVLVRLVQYLNYLLVTALTLLHSLLSLQKRPFSQASIGLKFTGQVKVACTIGSNVVITN
jgi:hypothetical protein